MNEYEVRYVYEFLNITTIVIADNKKQAKRYASDRVLEFLMYDPADNCDEIVITKTGEYR